MIDRDRLYARLRAEGVEPLDALAYMLAVSHFVTAHEALICQVDTEDADTFAAAVSADISSLPITSEGDTR